MDAENKTKNDFDRWLDTALHSRADAEPRMGLEDRILTRLALEPRRRIFVWRPGLTVVTAMLAIAIALVLVNSGRQKGITKFPNHAHMSPPAQVNPVSRPGNTGDKVLRCCVPAKMSARTMPSASVRRSRYDKPSVRGQHEELPKLASFPSPRPQTAGERMLAQLAARRGSFDVASVKIDSPPQNLSVPDLKIDPMEGTPPDESPQE